MNQKTEFCRTVAEDNVSESNIQTAKRLKRRGNYDGGVTIHKDKRTGEIVQSVQVSKDGKFITINNRGGKAQVFVDDLENDIPNLYYPDV